MKLGLRAASAARSVGGKGSGRVPGPWGQAGLCSDSSSATSGRVTNLLDSVSSLVRWRKYIIS